MKIKSFFSQYLPVIISAIILTVCLAYAWAPPASPPPSGNVSVPINTGSEDQSKLGGFGLGGGIGQAIQWLKNIGGTLKIIDEEGIASLEIGQDNVVSIKDSGNDGKLRIGDSAGANAEICLNDQCFKKADLLAGGGGYNNATMCYVNCEASNNAGCLPGYTRVFLYGAGIGCATEGGGHGSNVATLISIGGNLIGYCSVSGDCSTTAREMCRIEGVTESVATAIVQDFQTCCSWHISKPSSCAICCQ